MNEREQIEQWSKLEAALPELVIPLDTTGHHIECGALGGNQCKYQLRECPDTSLVGWFYWGAIRAINQFGAEDRDSWLVKRALLLPDYVAGYKAGARLLAKMQ